MKLIYIIIPVAVAVAIAIFKGHDIEKFLKKPETLEYIKKCVLLAEKYIVGTEKGQDRLEYACKWLYDYLPGWAKNAVTEDMIEEAINYVFAQLAEKMEGHTIAVDKPVK